MDRKPSTCPTQILKKLLMAKLESIGQQCAAPKQRPELSHHELLKLQWAQPQTCISTSLSRQVCCRSGSPQLELGHEYPRILPQQTTPGMDKANYCCQLLELTSASSLLYGLYRLKQLGQCHCLSNRAFVSKLYQVRNCFFSNH